MNQRRKFLTRTIASHSNRPPTGRNRGVIRWANGNRYHDLGECKGSRLNRRLTLRRGSRSDFEPGQFLLKIAFSTLEFIDRLFDIAEGFSSFLRGGAELNHGFTNLIRTFGRSEERRVGKEC